jgi:hypothetical protein
MLEATTSNEVEEKSNDILLVHGLGGWKSRLAIKTLVFVLNRRPNKQKIHAFTPRWQSNEKASNKLNRRLQAYWEEKGRPTILVGISAGANPVRYLAMRNQDTEFDMHLVAGYIGDGSDISKRHRIEAPSFSKVAELTHQQLAETPEDPSHITLNLPIRDDVIAEHNLLIAGAHQEQIPREGHSKAIAWWLLHRLHKLAS